MALFSGTAPQTLESALGAQAQSQQANLSDQYVQGKRKLVGQEAANGRLMSGVSNYPLTDLDTGYTQAQSGVEDSLANALAGVSSEDWLNSQEFQRQKSLAEYIGKENKPSTLQGVFQGVGSGASTGSMFGPWGALIGGVGGGIMGGVASNQG